MDRTVEREGERDAQLTFTMLKPLCTQLLDLSSTSSEDRGMVLNALQKVLKKVPSAGLQRCIDYALFPLVLLLDAAVANRSSKPLHQMEFSAKNQEVRVGDRVAEGVLSCLEVILERCVLETPSQATMLLRKLTSAAMLSPKEAAEEFRQGVVKCLQALLQNLRPCGSSTCVCKQISPSPFVGLQQSPLAFFGECAIVKPEAEEHMEVSDTCPLGYLQSENMSVAIGHLISLLLQIAEAEAARGAVGSGKLRQHALSTLRTLILKVGTADGLAFFLPGVVSGFAKVIHSSRASKGNFRSSIPTGLVHTSGAAGWPAAVEEAVKGLTEMLVIVLGDEKNAELCSSPGSLEKDGLDKHEQVTAAAALETLQGLSMQLHRAGKEKSGQTAAPEISGSKAITSWGKQQTMDIVSTNQVATGGSSLPLRSRRTKEWLDLASSRVYALLSQTFPVLCAHQSAAVRVALTEATAILLATCGRSLKNCTTLFLECLLALSCDDWEHVASAAQAYLTLLFTPLGNDNFHFPRNNGKSMDVHEKQKTFHTCLVKISSSTLDQLPRMVFSSDIPMSVLHARRLTAAMYFLGPDGVSSQLLDTMASKQKFIQTLSQCLSFNTTFTGSLEQITSSRPVLSGPIISEVKSGDHGDDSEGLGEKRRDTASMRVEQGMQAENLPTMPPWLSLGSGSKLYHALIYILRLAGLSAVTDQNNGATLVSFMDLLLVNVRQAAATFSSYGNDMTLEERISGGQELRMAATSVCVLNEVIFGASGAWNRKLFLELGDQMLFRTLQCQMAKEKYSTAQQKDSAQDLQFENSEEFIPFQSLQARWQAADKDEVTKILSDCAGTTLHDYLSPEVWDQPTDLASATFANKAALDELPSVHTFQDNIMLQKVLVDGVGVLGIALGKAFEECGYLGLVLFPLLEKLASPSYHIQSAAAVVLNTLCSHCEYASVRELVVANVDLVIDSLCRQFRHLTMYPNAPNLLAAILHHTNVSADLLPLLEEPLRGIVLELDVLSRRNHPHFTVPLLKALREITRATKVEAGSLLEKAAKASLSCRSLLDTATPRKQEIADAGPDSRKVIEDCDLEQLVNEFTDRQRCRRAVAAIATSCLEACGPLLASKDPQPCLLALDTVEDGISTLSQAEQAFVHESKEKESIEQLCKLVGGVNESTSLASVSDNNEAEQKKLLPSMNRVWPHLVLCLRHAYTLVVVHAVAVIASTTIECGGDFFTRRFQKDAIPVLVTLLREGSFLTQKTKPKSPGLLLPLSKVRSQDSAPAAVLKVQVGVLEGITRIASTKKSASALLSSFGLVAAWVVLIACHVEALQEAAANAVLALSKVDPDLVWIFVMDMLYGSSNEEFHGASPMGFPSFHQIFPPCRSPRETLCIKYSEFEGDLTNFSKNAAQNLLTRLERIESP
ncbi:unnamed protein product [Calypogeia fissa]